MTATASHFRFCDSPREFQFAASGLSEICCTGVRSCQVGLDDVAGAVFAVLVAEPELAGFAADGTDSGVWTPVCAEARASARLSNANKKKALPRPWRLVVDGCGY